MALIWTGPDGHSQEPYRPSVARAMQPVEQSLGARRREEFSHRILWHGVDSASATASASSDFRSESSGEGGVR